MPWLTRQYNWLIFLTSKSSNLLTITYYVQQKTCNRYTNRWANNGTMPIKSNAIVLSGETKKPFGENIPASLDVDCTKVKIFDITHKFKCYIAWKPILATIDCVLWCRVQIFIPRQLYFDLVSLVLQPEWLILYYANEAVKALLFEYLISPSDILLSSYYAYKCHLEPGSWRLLIPPSPRMRRLKDILFQDNLIL